MRREREGRSSLSLLALSLLLDLLLRAPQFLLEHFCVLTCVSLFRFPASSALVFASAIADTVVVASLLLSLPLSNLSRALALQTLYPCLRA